MLSTKGLVSQQEAIVELLQQTLLSVRFDEPQRIKELVGQLRSRRQQSVGQSGHSFCTRCCKSQYERRSKPAVQCEWVGWVNLAAKA